MGKEGRECRFWIGGYAVARTGVSKEARSRVLDELEFVGKFRGDAVDETTAGVDAGCDEGTHQGFSSKERE